jgi:hypothetical protein
LHTTIDMSFLVIMRYFGDLIDAALLALRVETRAEPIDLCVEILDKNPK